MAEGRGSERGGRGGRGAPRTVHIAAATDLLKPERRAASPAPGADHEGRTESLIVRPSKSVAKGRQEKLRLVEAFNLWTTSAGLGGPVSKILDCAGCEKVSPFES